MMKSKTDCSSSSSTSSESSDDEEEKRRISEAVLGVGASAFRGNESGNKIKTQPDPRGTSQKEPVKPDLKTLSADGKTRSEIATLKSNRPQDRNEEDQEALLKTTPEFRAYVAKQLAKLLDGDLSECLAESAWETHLKANNNYNGVTGVKLFSDSQGWFEFKSKQRKVEERQQPRKRKIRLSSSSDSSEDEDIKACVYSVADIEQENLRLARLEKQPAELKSSTSLLQASKTDSQPQDNHSETEKIESESSRPSKKKKKRKKKKNTETGNT